MAARGRSRSKSQTEAPNNPTEEVAVSTATAEAPAETQPEAEKKEEKVIDLTNFQQVVAAAVAEADADTGTVPEASVQAVTAAYRELDGAKAKNEAKKYVNEQMKDQMNSGDLGKARAFLQLSDDALVAASSGGGAGRQPADPTEAAVLRVATLQLARTFVVVPDGIADDFDERVGKLIGEAEEGVKQYLAWMQAEGEDKGEEPDVSAVAKSAAKLALGKSARAGAAVRTGGRSGPGYTGERRDTAKHITSVFADKPVGTFLTIAEIRNEKSEEYGDDAPSAGAVSARLFPRSGAESALVKLGIRPDTQNNRKGAVKVAEAPEDEGE